MSGVSCRRAPVWLLGAVVCLSGCGAGSSSPATTTRSSTTARTTSDPAELFRYDASESLSVRVVTALPAADRPAVAVKQVANIPSAVYAAAPRGDRHRLYVADRIGVIHLVVGGRVKQRPFLEIIDDVNPSGEMGFLSFAFDPAYERNRFVYVAYNAMDMAIIIKRYTSLGDRVDPRSGRLLARIPHADSPFHNGGQLAFGSDGQLYVGIGDGGYLDDAATRPDPRGNSQNLSVLLGKVFRLAPRQRRPRATIVAYGLRNPWRFSFAPNGDLIIADVGWKSFEEINVLRRGARLPVNFGWSLYEGRKRLRTGVRLNRKGRLAWPALVYRTNVGGNCSIIGGTVYRGSIAWLRGRYVYGDYCSGRIWSARLVRGRLSGVRLESIRVRRLASFGVDGRGELYAISLNGPVYQFVR